MIYVFKCEECGEEEEFHAPVSLLEQLKQGAVCADCQRPAVQVVSGGRAPFLRSPFPKGYHEHVSLDGAYIRDKHEAIDVAAENGKISAYCENDM